MRSITFSKLDPSAVKLAEVDRISRGYREHYNNSGDLLELSVIGVEDIDSILTDVLQDLKIDSKKVFHIDNEGRFWSVSLTMHFNGVAELSICGEDDKVIFQHRLSILRILDDLLKMADYIGMTLQQESLENLKNLQATLRQSTRTHTDLMKRD